MPPLVNDVTMRRSVASVQGQPRPYVRRSIPTWVIPPFEGSDFQNSVCFSDAKIRNIPHQATLLSPKSLPGLSACGTRAAWQEGSRFCGSLSHRMQCSPTHLPFRLACWPPRERGVGCAASLHLCDARQLPNQGPTTMTSSRPFRFAGGRPGCDPLSALARSSTLTKGP